MIKPTVGRKVWYRPSPSDGIGPMPMLFSHGQPLDATIIHIWGDRMVNVLVTDMYGRQFPVAFCTLVQEGDQKPDGRYVEWMPYQQGQAKDSGLSAASINGKDGFVEKPLAGKKEIEALHADNPIFNGDRA